jgi:mannose-6-phosphate isomerase-like protein (cupin superfamily)
MRKIGLSFFFAILATSAFAQQAAQTPPAPKTFTSSAEITAMIAKAKSEHKEGQALIAQRLLQLQPYTANLEYRESVGPAAVHEKEAEFFYVVDGSATIVTGGKLVNESRTNPTNLTGTAIEGGISQDVAKGDVIFVPENTPHWFSTIKQTLVLVSMHVPRPVPTAAP